MKQLWNQVKLTHKLHTSKNIRAPWWWSRTEAETRRSDN